jgi:DNA (cytosine-5)-methyltransferase 1
MKVGSLFSGIGGLDLGLERAGMTIAWHSEIDPYACKVLKKHWPEVPNHGDIKHIDWGTVEPVDVICGGYPCQPFSTAGKRRGEDDPRHLWPWVRDAISALRPRYAILENVRGHLSLGGLTVVGELAEIGYDAEWRVVSAAGVGAPHRRDRVIIVAYPSQLQRNGGNDYSRVSMERETIAEPRNGGGSPNVAYAQSGDGRSTQSHGVQTVYGKAAELREPSGGTATIGDWWQVEPDVGRVADGIPARLDRLRGLGNAVVPQVAEYIGRLVMAHAQHN